MLLGFDGLGKRVDDRAGRSYRAAAYEVRPRRVRSHAKDYRVQQPWKDRAQLVDPRLGDRAISCCLEVGEESYRDAVLMFRLFGFDRPPAQLVHRVRMHEVRDGGVCAWPLSWK